MANVIVYFQDLNEAAQCRVRQELEAMLLAKGVVEPRQEEESDTAFTERFASEVDYYLNCYNFAHEYGA